MRGFGIDVDGAVSAEFGGFAGVIADGVLVADILGNFGGDDVDVSERVREEGETAGLVGEKLEGAAGAVGFLALVLIAEEQADGIDDGTLQILNTTDGLLEVQRGGVVFAVSDDEEDLLGEPGAVGELIGGGDDGVVEGGAAAGFDVGEALAQLVDVGGEVLIEEGLVGKVDDEGFVLGIGGAHEVESSGVDGGALVAHGAGVINENAEGNGHVRVGEGNDVLEDVVFVDVEIALLEVLDEVAVVVDNGAVEDDFVDVTGEGVDAVLALRLLAGGGMGGIDGGVIGRVRGDDGVAVDVERRLVFGLLWRRNDGGSGLGWLGRSVLGSGGRWRGRGWLLREECQGAGSEKKTAKEEEAKVTAKAHSSRFEHARSAAGRPGGGCSLTFTLRHLPSILALSVL